MRRYSSLIAITGGIGAGKSVVSETLRCMGFSVYDCDHNAKRLMDVDHEIQHRLCDEIHHNTVKDGIINRKLISEIVFNDVDKLQMLNNIVHEAVRHDLSDWVSYHSNEKKIFVETAILYQSHLDQMVHEVWEVLAPANVRINRVMERNSMTRDEVIKRIDKQDSYIPPKKHERIYTILNDGTTPILPQIHSLLR